MNGAGEVGAAVAGVVCGRPEDEWGARVHVCLMHAQIGEFIGASRETVTRTLRDMRHRGLVDQHGPTFTISDRMALECYAQMQAAMNETCSSERRQPPLPNSRDAKGFHAAFDAGETGKAGRRKLLRSSTA